MILSCAIKRDYLGIPYLIVCSDGACNKDSILVNSTMLGPSPDFRYAFCLRPITKDNFLMQITEFKSVEACLESRASKAAEYLPVDVKHSFVNLDSFQVDSNRVYALKDFLLHLLPSGPETRALISGSEGFISWCSWIKECFLGLTLTQGKASDYAFYATLLPGRSISRVVGLVSRNENEKIEKVLETLLLGSRVTNHGVRMSFPIAKRVLESLEQVTTDFSFSFQRHAFYLRSLCSLVFPFDSINWFSGFSKSEVLPVEKVCDKQVVLASAAGVSLSEGQFMRYEDDIVSFVADNCPSITVNIQGSQVPFDKRNLSLSGHVVWGPLWSPNTSYDDLLDGIEGQFFYDGKIITRLAEGMTGYDLVNKVWVSSHFNSSFKS